MSSPVSPARVLAPLFAIQFLSWAGMFCLWIYAVPVIGGDVFHGGNDPARMGVALAAIGGGYALYAVLGAALAFALPAAMARAGVRLTYAGALVCAAIGIAALGLARDPWAMVPAFAAIGVGWGAMGNIPYAVASAVAPPGRGAHLLRVFSFSTVAPQVVTTLALALIGPHLAVGAMHLVLLAGGVLMALAAGLTLLFGGRFTVGAEDW